MKKLLRSPIIWIGVLSCAIIVFLYLRGFRITYAPELENSWDAISSFASWFGAIMSAVAIFVAINIPKKIAEQQNNISLFEKRYNSFDSFAFLTSAIKQIVDVKVKENDIKFYFDNMIATYNSVSITKELVSDYKDATSVYIKLLFEAGKIKYLFDLEEKEIEILIDFLLAVDQYISDIYKGVVANIEELRNIYTKLCSEEIQEKLEMQLKI